MKILGKSQIGYDLSDSETNSFRTFNPILNCENDFDIFEASDSDIELALLKAKACFTEFSTLGAKNRASFLLKIADKLDLNREILKELYSLESALPESRAEIELNRTIHQLKEFADLLSKENWNFCSEEKTDFDRKPTPKPHLQKYLQALGPVVVFGASNFPFAYSTIGGDSASALAAGCPVIVKSHPMHAGTGDLVAQLVLQAAKETGMPDGVFSNLNSKGIELGQKLVLHPFVKAVGFTGSFSGGMSIFRLAQNRPEPIPVFAEMGSVNPIFVFQSAYDFIGIETLVSQISASISLSAGQFCTNPGLLFLLESWQTNDFIEKLTFALNQVDSQAMLHPQIYQNFIENASKIESIESIVNLVETKNLKTNFIQPKLTLCDSKIFFENEILQDEVFGSYTLIVKCKNTVEFLEIAEFLKGQLTTSVFSDEAELLENIELLKHLNQKAGRLIFNGVPTGVEVCEAMNHGGPFPASSDSRFTAVGRDAIFRFLRPITYQNFSTKIINLLTT
ncbi:MAG: aldehyde dehydrogenase (NADP(+)) [Bacteroidota bacterium]